MTNDDTIDTSENARVEVMLALIKANQIPPFKSVELDSADDIPRMHAQVREMGNDVLFVFMVPREVSILGADAGACASMVLRDLPKNVHGKIIITFDGYNQDPRELHEVPEVVDFCLGLLLGPSPSTGADPEHFAAEILPLMLDERALHSTGFMQAFDVSGGLWLVSLAFARQCYMRSQRAPSGWLRDVSRTIEYFEALVRRR